MRTHKDRVTGCCRPLDCFGTRRGHPHRRMRMLERLRQNFNVIEREVRTAISKPLIAPCCQDYLDRLTKTEVALVLWHAESPELTRIESTAGTPIHPTPGQDVEQRDFLRQPNGMVERGERHSGADSQSIGPRGRVRAHHRD